MRRPTRLPYRGRLRRFGRIERSGTPKSLCRGIGDSMYTRKAYATRETPRRGQGRPTGRPRGTWAANAIVRFDPATDEFESFPSNRPHSDMLQMLGRKGETWVVESSNERIRVIL